MTNINLQINLRSSESVEDAPRRVRGNTGITLKTQRVNTNTLWGENREALTFCCVCCHGNVCATAPQPLIIIADRILSKPTNTAPDCSRMCVKKINPRLIYVFLHHESKDLKIKSKRCCGFITRIYTGHLLELAAPVSAHVWALTPARRIQAMLLRLHSAGLLLLLQLPSSPIWAVCVLSRQLAVTPPAWQQLPADNMHIFSHLQQSCIKMLRSVCMSVTAATSWVMIWD